MKRIEKYTIIIGIILLLCCGCKKKALPAPEYPLSLDVLNTILKEESLEWTVTETASVQDKHFTYTLSDSEQKMICLISTAKGNGDGRFLQIAFLSSPTNISTVLPYENWGSAITLAQMLYGNFQSKTQINDALAAAENDEFTIYDIQNPPSELSCKKFQWKKRFNQTNCIVTFLQFPEENDRLSLESIVLYDSDEFMQRSISKERNY